MTAAMFMRGFLAEDFGVMPNQMQWFQGGIEAPGREERVELDLTDVSVTHIPDRTLDEMLVAGDLDALFSATIPPSIRSGSSKVARLFDEPRTVEMDYYRRTAIFPIMHTVVVKRALVEQYPWLPTELQHGFERSKQAYYSRIAHSHNDPGCGLPFAHFELEETRAQFGNDFWPYGVERNLPTLEAAVRFSWQQGLSVRPVSVEEMFDAGAANLSVE
jgi:4,5-dihydroxyphthalate decarboxylase